MSEALFSPSWYRVASLRPRIRSHAEIHRHAYRGNVWFVLQDHATGRSHRFSPAAHHFIGLMDGDRTVQEIWDATAKTLGDAAPTQEEVIRLLGQLHSTDALLCDVPPDSAEVFRRHRRHERAEWRRRLWTPLAIRIPLWDPDRFLARTLPYVSWMFGWIGALVWIAVVGTGLVLMASNWTDLTKDVTDRVLAPQNLLLLWLVYPVVKALHELGHAYATRKWGGEVHDIGIMLLVLTPVPYVDASSSAGFGDKRKRMVVGAAGILVELFLASIALFVWLNVEPGAVKAVAYNIMLIGGVSTLLFNGNPLLRFDGYYVLSDGIEIPNLGSRANKYIGYLVQRYCFKVAGADSPAESPGERGWMVFYAVASFLYRVFIMFAIIVFIAGEFFAVGILLAIWAIATQVFVPMGKSLSFLAASPGLRKQRGRAMGTTALVVLAVLSLVFVMPVPSWTRAEGVLWVPEESHVRAGTEGFIEKVLVPADAKVIKGQPLLEASDPFLRARVQVLEAQLKELTATYDALYSVDRVQAAAVREEMNTVEGNLAHTRQREEQLVFRSPADGRFIVPQASDLPGRFVTKGQLVGYVLDAKAITARVAVAQHEIVLVRQRTKDVEVMHAKWGADPAPAKVVREVPAASRQLPTAALGSTGGGLFAVDPRDNKGVSTLDNVFQVELALPKEPRSENLGARVYVRFDHGWEPVGFQVWRALRQLLLRQLDV